VASPRNIRERDRLRSKRADPAYRNAEAERARIRLRARRAAARDQADQAAPAERAVRITLPSADAERLAASLLASLAEAAAA